MKTYVFILAVILLASCQKHKEKKAWKAWYGTYQIDDDPVLMYDDFHGDSVYVTRLSINKDGISFSTESGTEPSCQFDKLDESDNAGFDYQLTFKEIRLFLFGSGYAGQLESPTEEELNNNKSYYLKRINDSKIMFMMQTTGAPNKQVILNLE